MRPNEVLINQISVKATHNQKGRDDWHEFFKTPFRQRVELRIWKIR